ncbi:hypothetical protein, partial [Acinetobacter baumannii]|uniref:hypothetical protein n=1 Tax=Acinetobacter baumannii TaxID=470 RepID=UPI00148DD66B
MEEYNGFIDVEAARADDRLSEREALSFYRDCAVSGFQFRLCLQFRDSGRLDKAAAVLRLSPGRYSTGKGSICSFMQSRFGQPKIIEDQDLPENAPLPEVERRVWAGQYGESY